PRRPSPNDVPGPEDVGRDTRCHCLRPPRARRRDERGGEESEERRERRKKRTVGGADVAAANAPGRPSAAQTVSGRPGGAPREAASCLAFPPVRRRLSAATETRLGSAPDPCASDPQTIAQGFAQGRRRLSAPSNVRPRSGIDARGSVAISVLG